MNITTVVLEQSINLTAVPGLGQGPVLASTGIIDRFTSLSNDALNALRVFGSLLGVVAAMGVMWKARFALGGVLVGIAIGALIVWGVWNVDNETIRGEISGDLTSSVQVTSQLTHTPGHLLPPLST